MFEAHSDTAPEAAGYSNQAVHPMTILVCMGAYGLKEEDKNWHQ